MSGLLVLLWGKGALMTDLPVRALVLWQPWASLLFEINPDTGRPYKTLETRGYRWPSTVELPCRVLIFAAARHPETHDWDEGPYGELGVDVAGRAECVQWGKHPEATGWELYLPPMHEGVPLPLGCVLGDVVITDDWPPAPKDQRVTVDELLDFARYWSDEDCEALGDERTSAIMRRIREHGIDCGHQLLDQDEIQELIRLWWDDDNTCPDVDELTDAIVAKFVGVRDQGPDGVTLGGFCKTMPPEPPPHPVLAHSEIARITAGVLADGQFGIRVSKLYDAGAAVAAALAGVIVSDRPKVKLDDVAQAMYMEYHVHGQPHWTRLTDKSAWHNRARAALRVAGVECEEP